MSAITLCRLNDITDGGALGLPEHQQLHPGGLVAVRQGEQVRVYINRCPHFSVPLDYRPQEFCTYRGKILMCAHHSAMFRFEDGHCIDGPCKGARLEPVPVRWVEDRLVLDLEPQQQKNLCTAQSCAPSCQPDGAPGPTHIMGLRGKTGERRLT